MDSNSLPSLLFSYGLKVLLFALTITSWVIGHFSAAKRTFLPAIPCKEGNVQARRHESEVMGSNPGA